MWLVAEYQPVSLFSLKSSLATSTGAKTLLIPSPFSIRTALLDAALRTQGIASGQLIFEIIKACELAVRPPNQIVVTNLLTKVQKPSRKKANKDENEESEGDELGQAMAKTIAFREYAQLWGNLGISIGGDSNSLPTVKDLALQINYLGKRGSFFQLLDAPQIQPELPPGYYPLKDIEFSTKTVPGELPPAFPLGVIQILDDWGSDLSFQKINIYTDAKIISNVDRIHRSIVFPYRLTSSSKSFSLYERFDL